jgi:aspartate/methionine/tyrosine aminotransferase
VLVVNSPSNPTGAVFSRATVERLLELSRRYGLTVVSDEVYEQIVFEGEHFSPAALDEDGRVVSVYSFSKGYAMTGWRIGYLAASAPIVEAIVKVQEAVVACPSWVAQQAAEAALAGPQEVVQTMRASYRDRRDLAMRLLVRHSLTTARPRGTFYALAAVEAAGADTYAFARRLLLEHRVAVAPGETFGPAGAGLARISFASPPAAIEEGIERLGRAVANARTEEVTHGPRQR